MKRVWQYNGGRDQTQARQKKKKKKRDHVALLERVCGLFSGDHPALSSVSFFGTADVQILLAANPSVFVFVRSRRRRCSFSSYTPPPRRSPTLHRLRTYNVLCNAALNLSLLLCRFFVWKWLFRGHSYKLYPGTHVLLRVHPHLVQEGRPRRVPKLPRPLQQDQEDPFAQGHDEGEATQRGENELQENTQPHDNVCHSCALCIRSCPSLSALRQVVLSA